MSFNTPQFWAFCILVISAFYLVPRRYRWLLLLAASYYFYASFRPDILAVLVGLTSYVYVVTRVMHAAATVTRRRALLVLNLAGPLGALVFFKYLGLLWEAVGYLASVLLHRTPQAAINILVPIGISFYVFKLVSYVLDVYHRRCPPEAHVGYFALYVAYFPQILAGPIERPGQLLPQLRRPVPFDAERSFAGLRLVAWGLFKKMVVADRLAFYVGQLFLAPQGQGLHLVLGAYLYYFEIYADFSGYSDISIGLSRMLGFSPPVNFDRPYLSRSVSQFWTRWHITLSTWLRDYLFLPIAYAVMRRTDDDGRHLGIQPETWGYVVGMTVTMLLGGLWHGAALTFVVWGALHGAFLVSSYATRSARRRVCRAIGLSRVPRLHHAVSVLLTFQFVTLAWIVFRAASLHDAWTYVHHMQFRLPAAGTVNLLFDSGVVAAMLAVEYIVRQDGAMRLLQRAPIEAKAVGYAFFVVVLIVLSVSASNPFIYFKF